MKEGIFGLPEGTNYFSAMRTRRKWLILARLPGVAVKYGLPAAVDAGLKLQDGAAAFFKIK